MAHRVERVPCRLSPDRSDQGSNPARGHLLHVLPAISHTFLSISLYNKHKKAKNKSLRKEHVMLSPASLTLTYEE